VFCVETQETLIDLQTVKVKYNDLWKTNITGRGIATCQWYTVATRSSQPPE